MVNIFTRNNDNLFTVFQAIECEESQNSWVEKTKSHDSYCGDCKPLAGIARMHFPHYFDHF